jgi:hypothetical protein
MRQNMYLTPPPQFPRKRSSSWKATLSQRAALYPPSETDHICVQACGLDPAGVLHPSGRPQHQGGAGQDCQAGQGRCFYEGNAFPSFYHTNLPPVTPSYPVPKGLRKITKSAVI